MGETGQTSTPAATSVYESLTSRQEIIKPRGNNLLVLLLIAVIILGAIVVEGRIKIGQLESEIGISGKTYSTGSGLQGTVQSVQHELETLKSTNQQLSDLGSDNRASIYNLKRCLNSGLDMGC